MWKPILVIAIGSIAGGLLRWGLAMRLNGWLPNLPPGTLLANLLAGYIIGVALGYFALAPGIAPEWRLLIMTGFCGGLSTFSTFSGEVVTLLTRGQAGWAMAEIAMHVGGSLVMTAAGLATVHALKGH
jgi:fluoride exporter